ncbi:FAD-dependent monooxygenase [Nocardia grenadensis]
MRKRALVVGLGIAGMSAAIGLRRAGWTPVIVERAPERRTGGYFVGLFPEGRQAAVDLGITDHLHTRNPQRAARANSWSVDRRGRRRPTLGFLDRPGEPAAVLRGDIEAALWQNITGVEVRFGTTPVAITEGFAEVQVLLERPTPVRSTARASIWSSARTGCALACAGSCSVRTRTT